MDIVSKDPRTVVLMLDSPEPLVQARACEALLKYMQQCKTDVGLQTHTHTHTHTHTSINQEYITVSFYKLLKPVDLLTSVLTSYM